MVSKILAAILLPPFSLVLLFALGLLMLRRFPRGALRVLIFSTAALYLLAMPVTGTMLLWAIQGDAFLPASGIESRGEQAIVVLAGGLILDAPEYGGDSISKDSLERVRYGARLARLTELPLLVSGGGASTDSRAEAPAMKQTLEEEFGVPVRWVEGASRNTAESAQFTYDKLAPAQVKRIYLVTQGWHMRRSRAAFEQVGFAVTPAGTGYVRLGMPGVLSLLPNAGGLNNSATALREWMGLLWYKYAHGTRTSRPVPQPGS